MLQAIVDLQAANLPKSISAQEAVEQGFLSVEHSLSLLRDMNTPHPHTIAVDGNTLAGYALTMTVGFEDRIPFLKPFFQKVQQLSWRNQALKEIPYVLMGQVCVAKGYRGQGVFGGLYRKMRQQMTPHFEVIITEISGRNHRSLRAHTREGFETILKYNDPEGHPWVIVGLQCT